MTTDPTTTTEAAEIVAQPYEPARSFTWAQATKLGHEGLAQDATANGPVTVTVGKAKATNEDIALLALRTRRWARRHPAFKCHVRIVNDAKGQPTGFVVSPW